MLIWGLIPIFLVWMIKYLWVVVKEVIICANIVDMLLNNLSFFEIGGILLYLERNWCLM